MIPLPRRLAIKWADARAAPFAMLGPRAHANAKRRTYRDVYLESWGWRGFSRRVRKRARGRCEACDEVVGWKALHVHHRHYRTLGREKWPRDVAAVCHPCHRVADRRRRRR